MRARETLPAQSGPQIAGGSVNQSEKSMFAPTESPEPGPAPLGPIGSPHQLPVASWEAGWLLKTAVSPFPTMQLPVMLVAFSLFTPLLIASPSPGDVLPSTALPVTISVPQLSNPPPVQAAEVPEITLPFSITLVLSSLLRSEEHTSELQSRLHLVCRLL